MSISLTQLGILTSLIVLEQMTTIRGPIKNGRIDPKRVCLTCGKCGDLIRAHKPTGCVIRDNATFMPFYKEWLEEKKSLPSNFRG